MSNCVPSDAVFVNLPVQNFGEYPPPPKKRVSCFNNIKKCKKDPQQGYKYLAY